MAKRSIFFWLPSLALAAILVFALSRYRPSHRSLDKSPDTGNATWRGYDSGYNNRSEDKLEKADANQ